MKSLTYNWARRIAIALLGGTVILVGAAMLVLPGPGILVILFGLGILGVEFAWARVWLQHAKAAGKKVVHGATGRGGKLSSTDSPPPPPNSP